MPERFMAIFPGGSHVESVEIVRRPIIDDTEIVKAFANQAATVIPNAPVQGMSMGLRANGSEIVVATLIPQLTIAGKFVVVDGKAFMAGRENGVNMVLKWDPPPTMRILFAVHLANNSGRFQSQNCYLLAKSSRKPGNFLLPLPNVHEDARVCMGSGWSRYEGKSLIEAAERERAHFDTAPFNTDLFPSLECNRALFSFDPEKATQLPVVENWEEKCRKCNPTIGDMI